MTIRSRLLTLLDLFALALVACTSTSAVPAAQPHVDPLVAQIRVSGSGSVVPSLRVLAQEYGKLHSGVRFEISSGTNAAGAIKGVAEGSLDLAATSRALTESEAAAPLIHQVYARDAIIFAAHWPGPPPGLTTAQVRDLYRGRITSWRELGGEDRRVVVLDRDPDENSRKVAILPIMAGEPIDPGAVVLTSQSEMLTSLGGTPGAVGYTSLGVLNIERPKATVALQLDGVTPGADTLTDGRYPWQLSMGLVMHRDAPVDVKRFVEYVTHDGLEALRTYGYAHP